MCQRSTIFWRRSGSRSGTRSWRGSSRWTARSSCTPAAPTLSGFRPAGTCTRPSWPIKPLPVHRSPALTLYNQSFLSFLSSLAGTCTHPAAKHVSPVCHRTLHILHLSGLGFVFGGIVGGQRWARARRTGPDRAPCRSISTSREYFTILAYPEVLGFLCGARRLAHGGGRRGRGAGSGGRARGAGPGGAPCRCPMPS